MCGRRKAGDDELADILADRATGWHHANCADVGLVAMAEALVVTDPVRQYGTDTAAYLAYKAAVLSVGAYPIPAAEFASPSAVMRHIVLVVQAATGVRPVSVMPGRGDRRWWWHR